MSTRNRIALAIVALLISSAARSDGVYPGGLGFQDGINNGGTVAAFPVGCGLATTGALDLSVCSNTIYVAIGIM